MSSDQRPGKVRVFSSGAAAPNPGRRWSDHAEPENRSAKEQQSLPATTPAGKGGLLAQVGLFLLGCAMGGVLLVWFGLLPGARP